MAEEKDEETGEVREEEALSPGESEELRLPLLGHLDELRSRLTRALLAVAAGSVLCYAKAETLYRALLKPLLASLPPGSHLVFTEVTEAFLTYFKVALFGGLFLGSPVVFFQLWRFISPGLYPRERRLALVFAGSCFLALAAGAAFGYLVALPVLFRFLFSFGTPWVTALPSMKESLDLVLRLLFVFSILFELPLVLYLLGRIGIVTAAGLRKGRRYALVAVVVAAAVLTPPDVVSQLLLAAPLYLLFEAGIVLCAVGGRKGERGAVP
jgi:sec-independent protein translocase protein TatC